MRRKICFVTGTRAEFGLMRSALRAIRNHPKLRLQIIATGMHLDPAHGGGLGSLEQEGLKIDRVVSWESNSGRDRATNARNTGIAITRMADTFADLKPDIVLVTGDRTEAFAAATAAHLCGLVVAHIHGGDRAAGQVDDSLRHAITKLAHIHFPATAESAKRIYQLGEDQWRIVRAGAPGLKGITTSAASAHELRESMGPLARHRFALILLHPADPNERTEYRRAQIVLKAAADVPFEQIVIVYPNNDPGCRGIMRCWKELPLDTHTGRFRVRRDLPRNIFLGLLRDAAVLIGNSSSGIIEAASFHTPVVDIGPRQAGRQRSRNVVKLQYDKRKIDAVLHRIWNRGRPRRSRSDNVYGGRRSGQIIASTLARFAINDRLLRKLIRY